MAWRRYLKNPWFYVSVIVLLVALFLGAKERIDLYTLYQSYLSDPPADVNIEAVRETVATFNAYDVFIDGIGFGTSALYSYLAMLSVGFLFTGDFAQRLADGSGLTEIVRVGFKRYYRREVVKNALSTFFFICLVLLLFFAACLLRFPVQAPPGYDRGLHLLTNLYFDAPFLYCLLQIANQALYLALFSLLCMGTAAFIRNAFASRIAPLLLYLFLLIVPQLLRRLLGAPYFGLLYPDLIFKPFKMDGGTALGFAGEKVAAYLLLAAATLCVHGYMYRKYRRNYLG